MNFSIVDSLLPAENNWRTSGKTSTIAILLRSYIYHLKCIYKIDREARTSLRQGLKRPRDAYKEAEARLISDSRNFGERAPDIQVEAELAFPDWNVLSVPSSYAMNAAMSCPTVESLVVNSRRRSHNISVC